MTLSKALIRSCGRGNTGACNIARKIVKLRAMYAASVLSFADIPDDDDHPNKLPFSGTLLLVDKPSNKPPHGSQGHRIFVPRKVAANKLEGLIGMAVNYDPGDLDEHSTRHKVGVITKASIDGDAVKVSGFVWKKDFPESIRDLSKKKDLGMSMELADVYVKDENESVWYLEDFEFTGATILKKDAAAYTETSLAAKAAAMSEEGEKMKKPKEKEKKVAAAKDTGQDNGSLALMAQAFAGSLGPALQNALAPVVTEIKASNQRVMDELAEVNGRITLQAAATTSVEEEDDDEIVLTAAKEEDESDEDDMAAARHDESDEDDDDDMAAARGGGGGDESSDDDSSEEDDDASLEAMEDLELEDASQEPGEVNKDASNRGSKTTVTKPPKQGEHFPGNVAKGRIHSAGKKGKMKGNKTPFPNVHASNIEAAAVQIHTLRAQNVRLRRNIQAMAQKMDKDNKRLRTQVRSLNASLERFADMEARRSVMPVELTNLAAKSGINLPEIKANGQKLSVDTVDTMFANAKNMGIHIPPDQRIAMKMLMEEQGILDQGIVDRGYGRAN